MAIDKNGNHGVSRAPLPSDGIDCRICGDSGLYNWQGKWEVCKAPHTEGKREELQRQADGSNEAMAKLEAKVKR